MKCAGCVTYLRVFFSTDVRQPLLHVYVCVYVCVYVYVYMCVRVYMCVQGVSRTSVYFPLI